MKILIIGVGGYIGAKLIKSDFLDVTIVARGKHLEAIKKNGLTIHDEENEFKIDSYRITDNISQNEPYDLVLVTTKSYDIIDALESAKSSMTNKTILIAIANGVQNQENIKKYFPNNPTCEACIYILSNIIKPGIIKKYGGVFRIYIGSNEVNHTQLEEICKIFNNAELPTKILKYITLQC